MSCQDLIQKPVPTGIKLYRQPTGPGQQPEYLGTVVEQPAAIGTGTAWQAVGRSGRLLKNSQHYSSCSAAVDLLQLDRRLKQAVARRQKPKQQKGRLQDRLPVIAATEQPTGQNRDLIQKASRAGFRQPVRYRQPQQPS